jgi:hypothetical protein
MEIITTIKINGIIKNLQELLGKEMKIQKELNI